MKTVFIKHAVISLLLVLATACDRGSAGTSSETTINPSGNNNPSDDAKGNHADDTQASPGTNYPGSAGGDTVGRQKNDTLHKGRL